MDKIKIKSTLGRSWPAHGFEIKPGDNDIPVRTEAEKNLLLSLVANFVDAGQMVVMDGSDPSVGMAANIDAAVKLEADAKIKADSRARAAARAELAEIAKLDADAAAADAAEAKIKTEADRQQQKR